MTDFVYLGQLLLVGGVLLLLAGRNDSLLQIYICIWLVLNFALMYRYGVDGQLIFYSNDQVYYAGVVESLVSEGLPFDVDWWLTASRWPYTLPAALLSLAGVVPAISAKIVSLLFLLASVRLVRRTLEPATQRQSIGVLYLAALGGIGIFFSALALRETMMMYLVLVVFLGRLPTHRAIAVLLLFFLRQHLAVAIVIALVITTVFRRACSAPWTPWRAVLTVLIGNALGYWMFSLGFQYLRGSSGVFGHQLGIRPVSRIFSNYFGLQFLTAFEESLEFSLSSLLVSRILFSETILIPTAFTLLALSFRRLNALGRSVLLTFSIYVGLVTNTEFNSFRQNIPMIPVMGLVVSQHLLARRNTRVNIATGKHGT